MNYIDQLLEGIEKDGRAEGNEEYAMRSAPGRTKWENSCYRCPATPPKYEVKNNNKPRFV